MFDWLRRNPAKKLQKAYEHKLEEAMLASRNGDMRANATLTEQAEALRLEIECLREG